jgi:hypothetical protein
MYIYLVEEMGVLGIQSTNEDGGLCSYKIPSSPWQSIASLVAELILAVSQSDRIPKNPLVAAYLTPKLRK